jgi:aspartyl-tRNA synthetase
MTDHTAPTGPIENRPTALRTHLCGVLRSSDEGTKVRVCGWVGRRREHGEHLAFIDLRDHTGVIQCVIDTKVDVRSEWVIAIEGTVRRRPEGTVNPGLDTGEVEVGDCTVVVLNEAEPPPFSVDDRDESDEQVRLRYRYIDLRRPRMQRNLRLRARVNAAIRAAMDRQGFCEVETPLLWAPTPEGSREFSVPSRLHHGSFYALPQSPQLAKQLLMVGGFDRYYQIARCLRDEDLRADRQFEFSQLDMEASFATQDDVMAYVSEAVLDAAEAATGERPPPIAHMTWSDALDRFGTDKPDLRFGMELVDLGAEFEKTEVRAFSGSHLKALCVPGGAALTRSRLDALEEQAKRAGAGGLARFRVTAAEGDAALALDSPLDRFLSDTERVALLEKTGAQEGDLILAVSDTHRIACTTLGTLRAALGSPLRVGGRLPHVRRRRRRRESAAGPSPVHHALRRRPATARHGPVRRALAGLRPRPQRVGAGIGQRPYPSAGHPGADLRHARHQHRGGREALRLPAQRVPLRRAAARRLRLRHRPPGGRAGGGGEHP